MPTEAMMPRYQCHKQVFALKIAKVEGCTITPADDGYAPFEVDSSLYLRYTPTSGDYYVVYEDGYKSFSPAKAFEEAGPEARPTLDLHWRHRPADRPHGPDARRRSADHVLISKGGGKRREAQLSALPLPRMTSR